MDQRPQFMSNLVEPIWTALGSRVELSRRLCSGRDPAPRRHITRSPGAITTRRTLGYAAGVVRPHPEHIMGYGLARSGRRALSSEVQQYLALDESELLMEIARLADPRAPLSNPEHRRAAGYAVVEGQLGRIRGIICPRRELIDSPEFELATVIIG